MGVALSMFGMTCPFSGMTRLSIAGSSSWTLIGSSYTGSHFPFCLLVLLTPVHSYAIRYFGVFGERAKCVLVSLKFMQEPASRMFWIILVRVRTGIFKKSDAYILFVVICWAACTLVLTLHRQCLPWIELMTSASSTLHKCYISTGFQRWLLQ